MKSELPESIEELIDLKGFRERSGMYIGKKDIEVFRGFVDGYLFSQQHKGDNIEEISDLFTRFRNWLAQKFNQPQTTSGWHHMILKIAEGNAETAMDQFFQLFDEFRENI